MVANILETRPPQIVVPPYQRSYCWTRLQVEAMWEDLIRFERQCPKIGNVTDAYFFGPMVMLIEKDGTYTLLDGQQRLATCVILFSVAAKYLQRDDELRANMLIDRYVVGGSFRADSFRKLLLNTNDQAFFNTEVSSFSKATPMIPKFRSHKLIREARAFFDKQFAEKYKEMDSDSSYKWALRLIDVLLSNFTIIEVLSTDSENAPLIFETLNDRGIGLSTADLLSSLMISRCSETNRKEVARLWNDILQMGDDTVLKSFLRTYWIAYHEDIKTKGLYNEIRREIRETNINSLEFSNALHNASLIYRDMLEAEDDDEEVARMLEDVNQLGAEEIYPYYIENVSLANRSYV
jgi:uncharacterized protein with ParB-like and HNH nuclease domain